MFSLESFFFPPPDGYFTLLDIAKKMGPKRLGEPIFDV